MNEKQDSQNASMPSNDWKLGSLLTCTQDDYPGLGAWFGQIWEGNDVVARVYGNDHKQVRERASKLLSAPTARQDASAAQAVELPAFTVQFDSQDFYSADAVRSVVLGERRNVLLGVLQKLNGNPYNLTKSECLDVVREMFNGADAALSSRLAQAAPEPRCPVCRDSGIMGHSDLCVACDGAKWRDEEEAQPSKQAQPMDVSSGHKAQQPASAPADVQNDGAVLSDELIELIYATSGTPLRAFARAIERETIKACKAAPADVLKGEPVAWRIRYADPGGHTHTIYHGHNAIADYRAIDPAAISTPLYTAPADTSSPLPRPSVHAAAHYAGFLRRHSYGFDQPKRGAIENAAVMVELLQQETRRLHQELIDAQEASARDAAAIRNQAYERAAQVADYTAAEGRYDFQRAYQQGRQDAARKVRALKTDQQEKGNA